MKNGILIGFLFVMLSALMAHGADFTPFTWPASNSGPYTLVSVISNATVFAPSADESSETNTASHKYSHHTRIWHYHNITWIAFSSACTNEEDPGMQSVLCWSTNRGGTWSSPPTQVVPSQSTFGCEAIAATNMYRVSYPRNFTFHNGTNYLTCAVDEYQDTNGAQHGAALLSCALYEDGTIGPLFRISSTNYAELDGKPVADYDAVLGPSLMADSKVYGCWGGSYPTAWGDPQSEWFGWLYYYHAGGSSIFVEPSTFSVDGTTNNLYRIWRVASIVPTTNGLFVHQQMSTNGGADWIAEPVMTEIPNDPSETAAIRLTTGQYAICGSPQWYGAGARRDPLYLALSEPNTTTITNVSSVRQGISGTPVYPGSGKGYGAQYPSLVQVGNYLYISYSLVKEDIGFSRVLIPGLEDNNNDYYTGQNVSSAKAITIRIGTLTMP